MQLSEAPRYKKYVDIVGICIALFGVPAYFYSQYLEARAVRVANSLEYVNSYKSDPLLDLRISLLNSLADNASRALLASGPSMGTLIKHLEAKQEENPELGEAVLRIAHHFDAAQACVDAFQCDEGTMKTLLGREAMETYRLLGPFISSFAVRNRLSSTGCGLARMADAIVPSNCEDTFVSSSGEL